MSRRVVALMLLAGSLAVAAFGSSASHGTSAWAWVAAPRPSATRSAAPTPARATAAPAAGAALGTAPSAPPVRTPGKPRAKRTDPDGSPMPRAASTSNTALRTTGTAEVALTFDDGPGPYTPQILAQLREHRVKATFCLVGVNVAANPGLVKAIVRDGHTLCNHTWRHDLSLGTRSREAIRADLQRTNDEIHKAVPGAPIRYFRHPGGYFTPNAVAVARELGMTSLGWNVDPVDWNLKAYPAGPAMTDHIVATVKHGVRPGAIVLSHDGGGDRSSTIAAYRVLLPYLRERFRLTDQPG